MITSSYLLQLAAQLAVIVAAIVGLGWVLKRLGKGSSIGSGSIQVIATRSLGGKERLAVIQVGGRNLLVGISPGGLTRLHDYPPEAVNEPAELANLDAVPTGSKGLTT